MAFSFRPYPNALLNPCADPIFKSLFTQDSPQAKEALSSFLSALLDKQVTNIVLQPNELAVESIYDRQTQFDLTCIADSEPINVEMQGVNIHSLFHNRAEYHVAHLLNHFVTKGDSTEDIPKVYQISVVNFCINDSPEYFSHYSMKNSGGFSLGDRMNILFLELPKIKTLPDNVENLTDKELWGKFFLYGNDPAKKDLLEKMSCKNSGIKSAMDILQFLSKDELEWQRETSHWKYVMDVNTAKKEAAKLGYSEGFEKGEKNGLKNGLKKGMKQGMKEGIEQGAKQAKLEMATRLSSLGLSLEQIAQTTDLPLDEIKTLLSENKSPSLQ